MQELQEKPELEAELTEAEDEYSVKPRSSATYSCISRQY